MKAYVEISDFFLHKGGQAGLDVEEYSLTALSAFEYESLSFDQLVNDSRSCNAFSIFIAQQGGQAHGLDYLHQVLQSGCRLLISDRPVNDFERALLIEHAQQGNAVIFCYIASLEQSLASFCHWFYDNPCEQLKVIGITGTNGKTSTAFYCAQLLEYQQQRVAIIGTLGNGPLNDLSPSANTTPDIIRLIRLLAKYVEQNFEWVVMEVSSHAIALQRIQGVKFYATAITQIGSDHLDFHRSQQDYEQTKLKLFTDYPTKYQVLNVQDCLVHDFVQEMRCEKTPYHLKDAFFNAKQCIYGDELSLDKIKNWDAFSKVIGYSHPVYTATGVFFDLIQLTSQTQSKQAVHSPFLGQFNVENLVCSLSILECLGFRMAQLTPWLAKLKAVPGRMQVVHCSPTVIVDFAHTADGLENLLQAVKVHHTQDGGPKQKKQSRLWLVFGCGGNRDRLKRPLMAQTAQRYTQNIMLTSDNPRYEAPEAIINDILQGFSNSTAQLIQVDRKKAIQQVLTQASESDIVVIAGKGHENYQEVQGKKLPFNDQTVVKNFFSSKRKLC